MILRVRRWSVLSLLGWLGTAWSAPITFNTALPVQEHGWVLREQFVLSKNARDPSPADRDMKVSGLVSVLGYGITRDWALFGVLPYFDKRLDMSMGAQRVRRSEQGFGDLTVIGRYTAYVSDAPGRTFRTAPFAGVKAPTGRDDAQDGLGRLPPIVQLGTGEAVKLAVSEVYGCNYCLAAHSLLGKKAGLTEEEVISIRRGFSQKPKIGASVKFVNAVIHPKARVSDVDMRIVKAAGYNDAQITETLLTVAQTVFTNLFNRVHQTPLDFPPAAKI